MKFKTPERNIFSVWGVKPEIGGYGIAKYSHSHKNYQETIQALDQKKANDFYRKFYLEYKHKSVADLAHIIVIFENISNISREALWDDSLLDGQESSTRYLDFRGKGVHLPEEIIDSPYEKKFEKLAEEMVAKNAAFQDLLRDYLVNRLKEQKKYSKTSKKDLAKFAKSKVFDIARYLLPAGHYTNLGLIASGRTFERLANNLLAHPLTDIREVGKDLQKALAQKASFIPSQGEIAQLIETIAAKSPEALSEDINLLRKKLNFDIKALPTIGSFIQAHQYPNKTFQEIRKWIKDNVNIKRVDSLTREKVVLIRSHNLELETLTTLLYKLTSYSYRQLLHFVQKLPVKKRKELFKLAYKNRLNREELLRETSSGYRLIFDISSEFGTHKDLHRHRRCIKITKPFNAQHGYVTPQQIIDAGLMKKYQAAMDKVGQFANKLEQEKDKTLRMCSAYLLGYGWRRRFLMKMDARELQYIAELRTRPEGHFAYREIAWLMYQEFKKRFPYQSEYIKVYNPYKT
jgi:thymidylate synthase ThyX/mRNA-degrading endonuclease RelE of RelBE toxin-antitoxin system